MLTATITFLFKKTHVHTQIHLKQDDNASLGWMMEASKTHAVGFTILHGFFIPVLCSYFEFPLDRRKSLHFLYSRPVPRNLYLLTFLWLI